jgi:hypothetical protein
VGPELGELLDEERGALEQTLGFLEAVVPDLAEVRVVV